ncbi:MAG: putative DNA-binding domain-containing protein [Bdellovibrionales bacterium]|nr:putative DNA-binding domain-containing protein [Bdellovibrionales bacterium]
MLLKDWQNIFYQELQNRNLERSKSFISEELKNNITETRSFTKESRMQVYAYAFWARQVDSLLDDYPVLLVILGKKAFKDLLKDYIYYYPSTNYTLAELGRNLSKFMQDENMPKELCDLATFEWHLFELEYFKVEARPTATDIEKGDCYLKASVRVLQSDFPVINMYEEEKVLPAKMQSVVIVNNGTIEYYEVEPEAAVIIKAIQSGASFEDAILAAGDLSPEKVQEYFQDFMESGFFTSEPLATR